MERIQPRRERGLSAAGLRVWGLLFIALGAVGTGIIQNGILGLSSGKDLLTLLEQHPEMMRYATAAVVLQAMETCAVPIFAFLLTEGARHTSDLPRYLLRVLAVAAASEIPYNLLSEGKLLAFGARNPVFGLVFALIAIYFFRQYPEKSFKHLLLRLVVVICAAGWCAMLRVEYGGTLVIISAVLWAFRAKPSYRNIAGATATIACSLGSMFFMAAPMGFLAVFLYNGEKGEINPAVKYGAYPAVLLTAALAGMFL